MARRGRSGDAIDFTVLPDLAPGRGLEPRIGELLKLGFKRVVFMVPIVPAEKQLRMLDRYATIIGKFV